MFDKRLLGLMVAACLGVVPAYAAPPKATGSNVPVALPLEYSRLSWTNITEVPAKCADIQFTTFDGGISSWDAANRLVTEFGARPVTEKEARACAASYGSAGKRVRLVAAGSFSTTAAYGDVIPAFVRGEARTQAYRGRALWPAGTVFPYVQSRRLGFPRVPPIIPTY